MGPYSPWVHYRTSRAIFCRQCVLYLKRCCKITDPIPLSQCVAAITAFTRTAQSPVSPAHTETLTSCAVLIHKVFNQTNTLVRVAFTPHTQSTKLYRMRNYMSEVETCRTKTKMRISNLYEQCAYASFNSEIWAPRITWRPTYEISPAVWDTLASYHDMTPTFDLV